MSTIKTYNTYRDMIADTEPGDYAVIVNTGARFSRIDNNWMFGFVNQTDPDPIANQDDDYTAYDVWPNSTAYAVNDVLPTIEFAEGGSSYLSGKTVHYAIPADTTEKVDIRTYTPQTEQDVVIDWGDGSFTALKDVTPTVHASSTTPPNEPTEYRYSVTHTYTVPDKVYNVKIRGKKYYGVKHLFADFSGILCGCLGERTPIASHIINLAGFAGRSLRLFHVQVSEYIQSAQIISLGNTFLYCENLEYAYGFSKLSSNLYQTQQCFGNCENLVHCDLRIPSHCTMKPENNPYKATYAYCKKLTADVLDLLPINGFIGPRVVFGAIFNTCPMLTCSDYERLGNMLWNNPYVHWIDPEISSAGNLAAFRACSAALRAHVPQSWGGTASNDIIKPSGPWVLEDVIGDAEGLACEISVVEAGKRYLCRVNADGTRNTSMSGAGDLWVGTVENSPIEAEIWIYFEEGEMASLNFPSSMGWTNEPSTSGGKYYIINIRNNVAVCTEYTPGVTA